jgi:hypothetical protein
MGFVKMKLTVPQAPQDVVYGGNVVNTTKMTPPPSLRRLR